MSSAKFIKAPWSKEYIEKLQKWQKDPYIHPYTCENDECREKLIPTQEGWVCKHCDYTQEWAIVLID